MVFKYIIVVAFAILMGQIVKHLNKKMPPVVGEEITHKAFFNSLKKDFKIDLKYSIIMSVIAVLAVYLLGFNLNTLLVILALPMFMIIFSIDARFQLIPDEAHIYIGILGIINLIANISEWLSYVLGAIIGGGIFLAIAGFAILVLKKEGMGFGDVKLMGALGFLLGAKSILAVTLCSFFIGAIIGGILLIVKRKEGQAYIAFGPFIIIGALIVMFFGADSVFNIYISLCMGLSNAITNIIFNANK